MKVTITVWRDAREDPPEFDTDVYTDQGFTGYYGVRGWWHDDPGMDGEGVPMDPWPSLWIELPDPPAKDGLEVKDLRAALDALEAFGVHGSAARLRAALPDEHHRYSVRGPITSMEFEGPSEPFPYAIEPLPDGEPGFMILVPRDSDWGRAIAAEEKAQEVPAADAGAGKDGT